VTPPENLENISLKPLNEVGDLTLHENGMKFIKVSFPLAAQVEGMPQWENMWVKVTCLTDRKGTLDNDPVSVKYVKRGDTVHFHKTKKRFEFLAK
jgi:uncharacterized protein YegJ (DUF2314 family)